MATRDLRFFDAPDPPLLPDGYPRRGISVVAALSTWLVHTNRRNNGAWTQRYEHGVPTTGLIPIPAPGSTGTTVHFLSAPSVGTAEMVLTSALSRAQLAWPHLQIEIVNERGH
jgi:topoisomerase IV subunit B